MTTNTNLRYSIDFYPASAAEESDADPTWHGEGTVLAVLYHTLAVSLNAPAIKVVYIDYCNETDESRYLVTNAANGDKLGVVYVATEELA